MRRSVGTNPAGVMLVMTTGACPSSPHDVLGAAHHGFEVHARHIPALFVWPTLKSSMRRVRGTRPPVASSTRHVDIHRYPSAVRNATRRYNREHRNRTNR
jgi:hypothetical protein